MGGGRADVRADRSHRYEDVAMCGSDDRMVDRMAHTRTRMAGRAGRLCSPRVDQSDESKTSRFISVEEVPSEQMRIPFLENRSLEIFLKPPTCSTMKGVSVVVVSSILYAPFFYKESAMVAFIFP
jgi:hypothetical protein